MKKQRMMPLLLFLPALWCLSCSPGTEVTKSWVDESFAGKPFKKLLVMAVVKDQWVRGAFETTLEEDLAANNVTVIRSMDVMEETEELTPEVFESKFLPLGIDAVLISREINRESREKVFYNLPQDYYGMYSYYAMSYTYYLQPSYIRQDEVFFVESNLYDVKTTRLVWSAVSESLAPQKATDVVIPLTKIVARSLRQDGFVK
jgi:hypothetical protein